MNDLIDRKLLIQAVQDLTDCYNGFSDTYDKACIIGLIEEQPRTEVVPWSFLERYADWFCGTPSHDEFVRMAKLFWESEHGEREETEDDND